MLAFLDFEASSLAKRSYPIEVAWVFEDGREESHLVRPAPDWTDWDPEAQAIHGIARDTLVDEGEPLDMVAARMVETLEGHTLLASAPSWDGKWLSALLRTAGWPRHRLRLGGTVAARRACATQIWRDAPMWSGLDVTSAVAALLEDEALARSHEVPTHRALPDARAERQRWLAVRDAARELAAGGPSA